MDRHAYKRSTPEGYIVEWYEDGRAYPLRNFGDYQSAAIEFARMVNAYAKDDLDRRIQGLIKTYNPEDKYSYPEHASVGIAKLTKQKI